MAICVIAENPKGSREVYEQVIQRVAQDGGEFPPPGAIFQVSGPAEPGWRVVSVWESREAYGASPPNAWRPRGRSSGSRGTT